MREDNYTFNDQPSTHDTFGFKVIADALAGIINTRPQADTPLTIGVYGPWGSGKTSLMRMLQDRLGDLAVPPGQRSDELTTPPTGSVSVWFNAWRYARHEEALWRALLICVVEAIRLQLLGTPDQPSAWLKCYAANEQQSQPDGKLPLEPADIERVRERLAQQLDNLIDSLYRSVEHEELGKLELDVGKAGSLAVRSLLRLSLSTLPLAGVISPLLEKAATASAEEVGKGVDIEHVLGIMRRQHSKVYSEQIQSLEQFHNKFESLLNEWFTRSHTLQQRLVIFVDDLDRCLPEDCIGVLEAIKVFFDLPGCVIVLGIDHDIVAQGIRYHYKAFADHGTSLPIEGRDYLEKIVQIPIFVPLLRQEDIAPFLRDRLTWLTGQQEGLDETAREQVINIFFHGLPRNPRVCKRAMNMLVVLDKLARGIEATTSQVYSRPLIAKLVVLRYRYPQIYDYLARDQRRLIVLERKASGKESDVSLGEFARYIQPAGRINEQAQIGSAEPDLTMMLIQEPLFERQSDDTVRQIIFLSSLLRSQAV